MTRFLLLLVAATTASAQLVSFGAKIGAPLKDSNLNSNSSPFSTSNIGRWSGGPTIELHLPYRFSIEVDALVSLSYADSNVRRPVGRSHIGWRYALYLRLQDAD